MDLLKPPLYPCKITEKKELSTISSHAILTPAMAALAPPIELSHGIRLQGSSLWMDATRPKPLSFVSHAHGDHFARHKKIICSPPTARLIGHRVSRAALEPHPCGEPFALDHLRLELRPAGHMLGSSQLLVDSGGRRLIYTGDFKLRPSLTAEPAEVLPCDTLVMECTFGKPHYRFPDRPALIQRLVSFIERAIEARQVPVLFVYQMGKGPEIAKLLDGLGYAVLLAPQIHTVVEHYRQLGYSFPRCEVMNGGNAYGRVVLLPPYLRRSPMMERLPRRRTAFLSGWAVDPDTIYRFGVDEAIPFSDHADFDELVDYVRRAGPSQVYTLHGPPEFAAHLRGLGYRAQHLEPRAQLPLWEE
jgi:Cft2 family RNA processing exonuclease